MTPEVVAKKKCLSK